MPSPFDDLDAHLSEAMLGVFGETAAMLRPRLPSQYSGRVADPDRPAMPLRGIYSAGPGDAQIKDAGARGMTGQTRVSSATAEFWVSAVTLAAMPYAIAQGDLIEFTDRAGSPALEVSALQPTDLGDVNLILTREDLP